MNKDQIIAHFAPENLREYFTVTSFQEGKTTWEIKLEENINLAPDELKSTTAVLNGYMNPIQVLDFPFKGKLVFLHFYRRRWKQAGETKDIYHNTYTFHKKGAKTTDDFGAFLKELNREEFDEFCSLWPILWDIAEDNI